jgi:hypothetical protein
MDRITKKLDNREPKIREHLVDIEKFQTMNWKLYSQTYNQVPQKGSKGSNLKMFSTFFQFNVGWCI